ncbi:molybdopterin oxidoreductase, iron sulfur subunit [Sulfurimonas gotlandica GD1]|uniref:Molybdopterin oxidoreductase, iron sulfur subunit n=1 Tax=Sulfurimonas gotlandica (strain DSM 19862 / JCM 16533 / GD1) TaxID=929558 RepID=B6BNX7_SULGG|nr:DmsC/YnfH family molybdoenzyme membrane anchor subunit [Sulfurimonas gotlandica]EDZ61224.1 4Fe-4S ferredoxin, iron-sulfur binding domain protein [Sulfurimonas gotlandica GD1]EHP28932.1 molybdopterin oxidoreductase, iron sulfur subunit [Sulfurimonas gotlandica GD1]
MQTPLESFIDYKADTGMQCGNYSINIPKLQEGEQYRFHFDATACVGCHCCEVACNEQNNNPADIKWRRVGEMEGGEFPAFTQLFNSMSCNHCIDPECLKGCPTNSYIKISETGIVVHDDDTCIGCQYCTWNCPYEVPTYHEERKIVTKCHMCHERLDVGQTPACVQACPSGAIEIEVVNIQKWLEKDIDKEGNMPFLPDARITNSTTRYTLPKKLPDSMKEVDEHILKPAHSELPLVFMTVLTQISLGGFAVLFLGDIMSLLGFEKVNWMMALLVMLPAAIGLPLSALHLGRPFLALTAMKNIKTSWLSREALALGVFTGLMNVVVVLYFLEMPQILILLIELITLIAGIYGIYAQSMIYRIKARPAWDRITTNMKFFGVTYIGPIMLSLVAVVLGMLEAAIPLVALGMLGALAQLFFTYEDARTLSSEGTNEYQLKRTLRLYEENFKNIRLFRFISIALGGVLLPLFSIVLLSTSAFGVASVSLTLSLVLIFASEISDRFLFYSTVVPLGMAGGFFVGKQR